jgi:hypothetical protein
MGGMVLKGLPTPIKLYKLSYQKQLAPQLAKSCVETVWSHTVEEIAVGAGNVAPTVRVSATLGDVQAPLVY